MNPGPRDDRDTVRDAACDLVETSSRLGALEGGANSYLTDPNYSTYGLRLEMAQAAVETAMVEVRRRVWLNEGRDR
jgi:hypothetical protein